MKRDPNKLDVPTGWHPRYLDLMGKTGLSGAELARRVRVSENTASHWRTGKTEVPGAVIAYLELLATIRKAGA